MFGQGLAISLPALELMKVQIGQSLFRADKLAGAPITDELRRTIWLMEQICADLELKLVFIARPEMFTDGETLGWLRQELGGIRDHVAISDGTTIRVIPDMRNHVFFYGLGRAADLKAFQRLERRVPELFSTVTSQINSALRIRNGQRKYTPPTIVFPGRELKTFLEPEFYGFYLNRYSVDDSAIRTAALGAIPHPEGQFDHLIYLPVTETSTTDATFIKTLAHLVVRAYFQPTLGIFMRLPFKVDDDDQIVARIRAVLKGIRSVGLPIPNVQASNVFFMTDDLDVGQLPEWILSVDFLGHDTFDFWRHSPSFYSCFREIQIVMRRGCHNPGQLSSIWTKMCGRNPKLLWPAFNSD